MKYFVCPLDKINLGIPAEQTERIIPNTRVQNNVHESENQETFISLPMLFHQKEAAAPHGLVLKNKGAQGAGSDAKTILLAPRIDIDIEIPEEEIHKLPEAFAGVFSFITGACFTGKGENLILILSPKKLTEVYHD